MAEKNSQFRGALTLPNAISLTRIPLAFLFLSEDPTYRYLALALAGLSDVLDGFIARRFQLKSRLGTLLDPITDKFFVVFVLGILLSEGYLKFWEAATMLSRDGALLIFGVYLALTGQLKGYRFRAIWWGKAATFLQLAVLVLLIGGMTIPPYIYACFVAIGCLALIELFITRKIKVY